MTRIKLAFHRPRPATILPLLAALTVFPVSARSEQISGREVMDRAKKSNQSNTQITEISMLLIDKKGKEQTRGLEIWAQQGERDKTLTRFTAPKNVEGVSFLAVSLGDGKANRWLYLPESKKTRQIAEGDNKESFMGTDFTYYDLSPHDLDNEEFDPVTTENVEGVPCYKVTGRSKSPDTSFYGNIINWVRKDNFVPIRIEFYDKEGKLLKRSTVIELENMKGNWTPMKVQMHNVQTDHKTVMTVDKVVYDTKIPSNTFEKSHLERGR